MGECGCGDGFGDVRLPGPDGSVYTIRIAQACDYCDTPLWLLIDRFSAEFAPDCPLDDIPELAMPPYAGKCDLLCGAIIIMQPETLARALFNAGMLREWGETWQDAADGGVVDEVRNVLNACALLKDANEVTDG